MGSPTCDNCGHLFVPERGTVLCGGCGPSSLLAQLDRLRRAVRALGGRAPEVLASVTPDALRAVLTARGWTFAVRGDGLPEERWDCGNDFVWMPVGSDLPRWGLRVTYFLDDPDVRGDLAPAELLAEVLTHVDAAVPK